MAEKKECDHSHCSSVPVNSSVCQTLSEMDWEKGIWNAALSGEKSKIELIISRSRNPVEAVNEPDNSGYTALHYAARYGHEDVCALLIKNGAKLNAPTKSAQATPLHKACVGGKTKVVQLLVKHGACLTVQDSDGQTALHKAILYNHSEIADILMKECPQLKDIADFKGNLAVTLKGK